MKVTFYGVRGSIPTPGVEYVKYGGNTACVHIELSNGTDIILDAGSGIRLLGKELIKKTSPIHILLTHNHWDHIQGFPFFAPIYQAGREIFITPGVTMPAEPEAILNQMRGTLFPITREQLSANISLVNTDTSIHKWQLESATITRMMMNHPGGGSCFCIEEAGAKVAYITDNELYPPYKKNSDFLQFSEFAKNANLLIHDAQYMIADMPAKSGWGHSVAEEAVKLALASGAETLALYSHDPERVDSNIDELVQRCQEVIEIAQMPIDLIAASEGLQLTF